MTDNVSPIDDSKVVVLQELSTPVIPCPVDSPYMVWVNVEGPLVPAAAPGMEGDYFWTEDGYLVLYFDLSPGDVVQLMLMDARQIYRFPEGAEKFTKLVQVPVFKRREPEEPSRIVI